MQLRKDLDRGKRFDRIVLDTTLENIAPALLGGTETEATDM